MCKMLITSFLFFLLANSIDLSTAVPVETNSTTDLRLFYYSPIIGIIVYEDQRKDKDNMVKIHLDLDNGVEAIGYYAKKSLLIWTMPRRGFWSTNAQLYTIPWNHTIRCEPEPIDLEDYADDKDDDDDVDGESNIKSDEKSDDKSAVESNTKSDVELDVKADDDSDVESNYNTDDDSDVDSNFNTDNDSDVESNYNTDARSRNAKSTGKKYCKEGRNRSFMNYVRQNKIKRRFEDENWNPRSLAIDYISGKVYIADTTSRSINVFTVQGKYRVFIFQNETLIPYEIGLDPPEGWMFVLAGNTELGVAQLYRVNMDGSDPKLIVDELYTFEFFHVREKIGFGLDTIKKRVYFWNPEQKVIETVDYQGNSRHIVTNAPYALSLSIHKDTLYFSHVMTNADKENACPLGDCYFWTCKINEMGICIKDSLEKLRHANTTSKYFLAFTSIKAIDQSLEDYNIDNPCEIERGGCQHQCLLKKFTDGNLGHSCVCKRGYKLLSDLKSCELEDVTRAYDDFILQKTMDYTSALKHTPENIFPISRELLVRLMYERPGRLFLQHPLVFFEINNTSSEPIEYSLTIRELDIEDERYHKRRWSTTEKAFRFARSQNATISEALAFDWITRNLYFVVTPTSEKLGKLIALKYPNHERISLKYNKKKFLKMRNVALSKVEAPVSMALHPYRGYLFMSLHNGSILRFNSDGSKRYLFPKVNNSILLTVDLNDDKLYWLADDGFISYSNLDGSDAKQLMKTYSNKTEVMYVYDKWLFTKSVEQLRIWRFDKLTGQDAGTISIDSKYMQRENIGFMVSARDAHYRDSINNPCVKKSDCSGMCFAKPDQKTDKLKKSCLCSTVRGFYNLNKLKRGLQ